MSDLELSPCNLSACVVRNNRLAVENKHGARKKREWFLGDQSFADDVSFRSDFSTHRDRFLWIWSGAAIDENRR